MRVWGFYYGEEGGGGRKKRKRTIVWVESAVWISYAAASAVESAEQWLDHLLWNSEEFSNLHVYLVLLPPEHQSPSLKCLQHLSYDYVTVTPAISHLILN